MKYLLDTHVWLWWMAGDPLSSEASTAIADPDNDVYLSAVSVWEAAIKASLGKLDVPDTLMAESAQFEELAISWVHADSVGVLPMHHRDPFDRLLIAQGRTESAIVITRDLAFEDYDVEVMWA
ncbi:MAG: type II toxin-antitoxin system VapC family toxin [Microthrixaceae bacterium]